MQKRAATALLVVILSCALSGGLGAQASDPRDFKGATPAPQRALFAVFLAFVGQIDTALSISNVLLAPPGLEDVMDQFPNREGTIEFYLWNGDGTLVFYSTDAASPGVGLTDFGTLPPGQTYRVLLSEILRAAEFEESFSGYGWMVANFNGVQGTANVTDFSTFTQTTVMQPDLGSTFFDFDANAGVPITPPPDIVEKAGGGKR